MCLVSYIHFAYRPVGRHVGIKYYKCLLITSSVQICASTYLSVPYLPSEFQTRGRPYLSIILMSSLSFSSCHSATFCNLPVYNVCSFHIQIPAYHIRKCVKKCSKYYYFHMRYQFQLTPNCLFQVNLY